MFDKRTKIYNIIRGKTKKSLNRAKSLIGIRHPTQSDN